MQSHKSRRTLTASSKPPLHAPESFLHLGLILVENPHVDQGWFSWPVKLLSKIWMQKNLPYTIRKGFIPTILCENFIILSRKLTELELESEKVDWVRVLSENSLTVSNQYFSWKVSWPLTMPKIQNLQISQKSRSNPSRSVGHQGPIRAIVHL